MPPHVHEITRSTPGMAPAPDRGAPCPSSPPRIVPAARPRPSSTRWSESTSRRSSHTHVRRALEACAAIAMQRGSMRALPDAPGDGEETVTAPEPPRVEAGAVERDGFNLHASVRIAADDDLGRERLMRYGARLPIALDRLRRLPGGPHLVPYQEASRRACETPRDDAARVSRAPRGHRRPAAISVAPVSRRPGAAVFVEAGRHTEGPEGRDLPEPTFDCLVGNDSANGRAVARARRACRAAQRNPASRERADPSRA